MRQEEKMQAYYRTARDAIDYMRNCAEHGMVPLKHDVNVYSCRLNRLRKEKVHR